MLGKDKKAVPATAAPAPVTVNFTGITREDFLLGVLIVAGAILMLAAALLVHAAVMHHALVA